MNTEKIKISRDVYGDWWFSLSGDSDLDMNISYLVGSFGNLMEFGSSVTVIELLDMAGKYCDNDKLNALGKLIRG